MPAPPRGLALQRSVSTRLMQADQLPAGEEMWVEDAKEVWVLAGLVSQHNTILKVRRKDTGALLDIDLVRQRNCKYHMHIAILLSTPSKQESAEKYWAAHLEPGILLRTSTQTNCCFWSSC